MDIFKMSKIEILNKVSKKKSEFWNCDDNALKFIFLVKKRVTITFLQIFGTKFSIQVFHLSDTFKKFKYFELQLCYHNPVENIM